MCLLGLSGDLRLANHHRIEGGCDAKKMAHRGSSEMDVETVIVWQLALSAGEIGKAAAKVEEQGVGVDACVTAEIELDPVAGSEVDKLGETRQARELDQILARKIGRKSGGRELFDRNGAVRGADDADTIQTQCLPAGFYDTTWRNSVTEE